MYIQTPTAPTNTHTTRSEGKNNTSIKDNLKIKEGLMLNKEIVAFIAFSVSSPLAPLIEAHD